MSVYKFEQWFKDQGGVWDTVDPGNEWNAAIDQVLNILLKNYDGVPYEVFEAVNGLKS